MDAFDLAWRYAAGAAIVVIIIVKEILRRRAPKRGQRSDPEDSSLPRSDQGGSGFDKK